MDKIAKPTETAPALASNGVYVRGIVVSNRARAIKRKDGSGITVIIEIEIGTQPGVVTWVRFVDPKTDNTVRVEGESVVEYPKLKEFQQVTIRANAIKSDERTGQLVIKAGELLA